MQSHNKSAFTLLELMILVSIIGIMASLFIPACMSMSENNDSIAPGMGGAQPY